MELKAETTANTLRYSPLGENLSERFSLDPNSLSNKPTEKSQVVKVPHSNRDCAWRPVLWPYKHI